MSPNVETYRRAIRKIIDRMGVSVTYHNRVKSGETSYGEPTYNVVDYTLKVAYRHLRMEDTRYVEAGFLPQHYLYLFLNYDDVTWTMNEMIDTVDYGGETYIVRLVIPIKVGTDIAYYKLLIRRKAMV